MRTSHSNGPLSLLVDPTTRTARLDVSSPARTSSASDADGLFARAARQLSSRTRARHSLRSLRAPSLSFDERSLPEDRPARSASPDSPDESLRAAARHELRSRRRSSSSTRESERAHRARTRPTSAITAATFVPVGHALSPGRFEMASTGASPRSITSPVRIAGNSTQQHQLASPSRLPITDGMSFSPVDAHMQSPPVSSLLSSSPQRPAAAALAAAPQVDWTVAQWHAWACTESDASSMPPLPAREPRESDRLLYPSSVLLSPRAPDGDATTAARTSDTTQLTEAQASTGASSPTLVAASPVSSPRPVASASVGRLAASPAISPRPLPSSVASPLQASPPASTLHSIASRALQNLRARLLLRRCYLLWTEELKRKQRMDQMLSFVSAHYDRNFLSFHFRSWVRARRVREHDRALARVESHAVEQRRIRNMQTPFKEWRERSAAAAQKQRRAEHIWSQTGHSLHPLRLLSSALAHWCVLSRHYARLSVVSAAHYSHRLARDAFYPWHRTANLLQVASMFARRVGLRDHWRAWRVAHVRRDRMRSLQVYFAEGRRARLFYAWHQLREERQQLKETQWKTWRRAFVLVRRVRDWHQRRVLRCWTRLLQRHADDVERCDAHLVLAQPVMHRRTVQAAWDEWRRKAEERFEANFLSSVDEWRRNSQRRRALSRWGALVSLRHRRRDLGELVIRHQQTQSQRIAVRAWAQRCKETDAAFNHRAEADEFYARHRLHAYVVRWLVRKNDGLILQSRANLLRLAQMRPFLRTLRLHAQFRAYLKRVRQTAQGYSLRRLGGVHWNEWAGRAESYRIGREQNMPAPFWKTGTSDAHTLASYVSKEVPVPPRIDGGVQTGNEPQHVPTSSALARLLAHSSPLTAGDLATSVSFTSTLPLASSSTHASAATGSALEALARPLLLNQSSAGQIAPIDHRESVSAFPRSEFIELPTRTATRILLDAVKGLPSHMLPRPPSAVVPQSYLESGARQQAERDAAEAFPPPTDLKFRLPLSVTSLEPTVAVPTRTPSTAVRMPTDGDSFAGTAATSLPFAGTSFTLSSSLPPPVASASVRIPTSAHVVVPKEVTSTRAPLPPHDRAPAAAAPPASRSVLLSTSFPSAARSADPVAQRKSNRQKLEMMLNLARMPTEQLYRSHQAEQEQAVRAEPRQSDASQQPATHTNAPALTTDEDDDDSNYRSQELSRLHYNINLMRRFMENWNRQRHMAKKEMPIANLVGSRLLLTYFSAWSTSYTAELKARLIRTRQHFLLIQGAMRCWQIRAAEREEERREKEQVLGDFMQSRTQENHFRAWYLAYLEACNQRKLEEKQLQERKIGLLSLLSDFTSARGFRVLAAIWPEWHRLMLLRRGERRRAERLDAQCREFIRTTVTRRICRAIVPSWHQHAQRRRAMREHFKTMLVDAAFERTAVGRAGHFLDRIAFLRARESQRTALRRWVRPIRIDRARRAMAIFAARFHVRELWHTWRTRAEAIRQQEEWNARHEALVSSQHDRLISAVWNHWSAISTERVRTRLHETLVQECTRAHRVRHTEQIFYSWFAAANAARKERAAREHTAAVEARRNQHYLSLQVALLCHKFASLRRTFRVWRQHQAARVDERRRANEVRLPVVPVFRDDAGLILQTEVRQETPQKTETPLPYGIIYQPYVVSETVDASTRMSPRTPLKLLPDRMALSDEFTSPHQLRGLVAPPEATPEEKRARRARKSVDGDTGAESTQHDATFAASASTNPLSPPLHIDDLMRTPGHSPERPRTSHASGGHASTDAHGASSPSSSTSRALFASSDPSPMPLAASAGKSVSFMEPIVDQSPEPSRMERTPVQYQAQTMPLPNEGDQRQTAASQESHALQQSEYHLAPFPSSPGRQADFEFAAPSSLHSSSRVSPPPEFVGFALPFEDLDSSSRGHSSRLRAPGSDLSDGARTSVVVSHQVDARHIHVPLRSVLSAGEDAIQLERMARPMVPRSRFADSASGTTQSRPALKTTAPQPPRRFHVASPNPLAEFADSYESIHRAHTAITGALQARRASQGPSVASARSKAVPPAGDSILSKAFEQQQQVNALRQARAKAEAAAQPLATAPKRIRPSRF